MFNTTGLTVPIAEAPPARDLRRGLEQQRLFAGTPGANNLIFNDTVNSDQTIQAYKARVTTRDSASFTENPTFLSTTARPAGVDAPLDANFLHINPATPTHLESGGVTIAGILDDFDGETRAATPDVGADEFTGTALAYNADLSNLTLSDGILSPAFASGTTSYTASVGFATTSITETPTVADTTSTVTVNGNPVVSGTPSGAIALAVGPNVITTVVTAQDGTTMETYTVTVTRAAAASGGSVRSDHQRGHALPSVCVRHIWLH